MTPKQVRFCEEFVVDHNATQAAIRAGYSVKTARIQASRLLSKVDISKKIADITDSIAEKLKFDQTKVFDELVKVAKKDPDSGVTTCKFSDKNKALELLGKHYGMFSEKLEVTQDAAPQVVLYWPENGRDSNETEGLENAND